MPTSQGNHHPKPEPVKLGTSKKTYATAHSLCINSGGVYPKLESTFPGVFAEAYEYIDRDYFGAPFDGLVFDWEGDGDPDLYICNDFGFMWGGNSLLINENHSFIAGDGRGSDIVTACMGASIADISMDDQLDIYITAAQGHHYLVQEESGFVEMTASSNLPFAEGEQMLWGEQVVDTDSEFEPTFSVLQKYPSSPT